MREGYKKFYRQVVVSKMADGCPQFSLRGSHATGGPPTQKSFHFFWRPVDKLTFTIEFRAPGLGDGFECSFMWSEGGKVLPSRAMQAPDAAFAEETLRLESVQAHIQVVSAAMGREHRVMKWTFWEPKAPFGIEPAVHAVWKAEFLAEEARPLGDAEARGRVEATVDRAMADIQRFGLPWFEAKLRWYREHRGTAGPVAP